MNWISQVAWNSTATPGSSEADLNKARTVCFWDWSVLTPVGPQVHTQIPLWTRHSLSHLARAFCWELTVEYPWGPAHHWRRMLHSWPQLISTGDKGLLTSVKRHMGEWCGSSCTHQCKESHIFSEKGKGASWPFSHRRLYFFRPALSWQQNWTENTEISHLPLHPPNTHPLPLSTSPTGGVHWL